MSQPHERLDKAMRRRGIQLGKRWVQIAADAGITTSALGAIRRGEYRPSAHTAAALDEALEWAPGSIDRILDGGDPEPTVYGSATTRPIDAPVDEDDDPRMQRAAELLAEAQALLEEIRRERREGA